MEEKREGEVDEGEMGLKDAVREWWMDRGRKDKMEGSREEGRSGWREGWNQGGREDRGNERDEWHDGAIAFPALSFWSMACFSPPFLCSMSDHPL